MNNDTKCPICQNPTFIENGKPQKQNLCYEHAQMLELDYKGLGKVTTKESTWLFFTKCYCCGNESDDWLCDNCRKLKKKGEVAKCYNCGEWYKIEKGCPNGCKQTFCSICGKDSKGKELCKNCYNQSTENLFNNTIEEVTTKRTSHRKCLLCDNSTNSEEYILCSSCYTSYKNKKLFLELSVNDTSIKILDANYEGRLECDDGHIVKSQAERDIDNYLFEKNIKHGYETILPIYDNGKRIELRPDFCIFNGHEKIYIEYWGIENDQIYENRKEFKMPLYKKAGITLINMYKKTDMRNIRASLEDKLKHYKKGQINFEE